MHINVLNSNCSGNNSSNKYNNSLQGENARQQNSPLKHLLKKRKKNKYNIHFKILTTVLYFAYLKLPNIIGVPSIIKYSTHPAFS